MNALKSPKNIGIIYKFHTVLLNGNDIGDEGLSHVSATVKIMPCLRILAVADNAITSNGLKLLCSSLEGHNQITCLDLGGNEIGDHTKPFIDLIKKTPSLKTLILKSNEIGSKGASYLADAIKSSKSIGFKCIDLENNDIDDSGANDIASALKSNSTLELLNLRGNEISEKGAKKLNDIFMAHVSLKEVNLSGNRWAANNVKK